MSSPQTRSPSPPFNNSTFILPTSIMSSHDHQFNNPNNTQHRQLSPQTISSLHHHQQSQHQQLQNHQQNNHSHQNQSHQNQPYYLHPQQLRSQPTVTHHNSSSSASSIDEVSFTQEKIDKELQIKDRDMPKKELDIELHTSISAENSKSVINLSKIKEAITEETNEIETLTPKISINTSITPPTSSSTTSSSTLKSCKRSSSASNDLLYERDRFRARLKSFNDCSHCEGSSKDTKSEGKACEVCDGIGFKTAKLNMNHLHSLHPTELSENVDDVTHEEVEKNIFDFKHITIQNLKLIFHKYFNSTLPKTQDVFPWLHGLHNDNFAQKSFFLQQQQQLQQKLGINNNFFFDYDLTKPKSTKFLMSISDETLPIQLHNSVKISEILQKIDVSKSEIKNIIESIWDDEIIDHKFLDVLVNDCISLNVLPIFLNLDPDRGISLRNFHIQVAKLSTCSDFVIYGSDKNKMMSMARVLWLAQKYDQQQYSVETVEEKTIYILDDDILDNCDIYEQLSNDEDDDSINVPLKHYFNFSKINPQRLNYKVKDPSLIWENDFQLNEKIETTKMSTATKINQNVWVGNFWDFQIMKHYINVKKKIESNHNSIQKDAYNDPQNSLILHKNLRSRDFIDLLPRPKSNYKLFLHCHSDATFPDLNELSKLLFQYTISSHDDNEEQERHYLNFPPSGSLGIGDCKRENLNSIINTCKLIYLYSSSNNDRGLSSLIYCSDGYTESSLFVFCFMIYSLNISLDEAILQLHLKYGRPYYIFNSDVIILNKLEPLLRKFSPLNLGEKMSWSKLEELNATEINEILLGRPKVQNNTRLGYIVNSDDEDDNYGQHHVDSSDFDTSSSNDDDDDDDDDVSDNESEESELKNFQIDWVKEVEGSIPSKILPYLYLGSLKHASCLPLLNKLGIKKIISVGENLPWINGYKFQKYNNILVDELEDQNIEFFNIIPKNPNSKSKLHWNTTIETIMKVNNLEDDGIDELSQQLPSMLEFIEKEFTRTNGQTKILIHCRVGVSRSATVVIAEIMRRLQINLSMAYLYVRVRRLNIIIQPNLRFMYELFKWEESIKLETKNQFLKGQTGESEVVNYNDGSIYLREIDWFIMCREIMKLNIPYLNN
ncbi:PPS1 [Candida pseudojiufengensis]|uniref:PPS1 n=1 Tax=Candida pseudojiufengensis TaxID=497109 RepID=UPI00222536C5|nr:PPS1 [Candida pseudojiufengensis]KAI5960780.1 PPS1 [Candida pseudojiufengensis]